MQVRVSVGVCGCRNRTQSNVAEQQRQRQDSMREGLAGQTAVHVCGPTGEAAALLGDGNPVVAMVVQAAAASAATAEG
jgi:uncharacterized ParB-like nuclease family protein